MNLFYVHSHITYLISMLYIANRGLDFNEVGFVVSRNYKVEEGYKVVDLSLFYTYLEKTNRFRKLLSLRREINKADQLISKEFNNSNFDLYVPQFNHSIFNILSSNKNCVSSYLIEEGITSYKRDIGLYKSDFSIINSLIKAIFNNRFILNNPHYSPFPALKFKNSITIDNECFPYLRKKEVLRFSRLDLEKTLNHYCSKVHDNTSILILDSFNIKSKLENNEYLKVIEKTIIMSRINPHTTLHIKFHPEHDYYQRELVVKFVEERFSQLNVSSLSDGVILEFEFLINKNLTCIGMHSSLLFYAKKINHNVFSSIGLTMQLPEVNRYVRHIMDSNQIKEYMTYEGK